VQELKALLRARQISLLTSPDQISKVYFLEYRPIKKHNPPLSVSMKNISVSNLTLHQAFGSHP